MLKGISDDRLKDKFMTVEKVTTAYTRLSMVHHQGLSYVVLSLKKMKQIRPRKET